MNRNFQPQYGHPPPPPQQQQQQHQYVSHPPPPQQQQQQQYARHQKQAFSQQVQLGPEEDEKAEEARKLAETKRKAVLKNENIHFNYFDEVQYGIPNFPVALSEVGVLCTKIKKKGLVIGCGSGRLVFEMAKHFTSMEGIDTNADLINSANAFKSNQSIEWEIPNHGDIVDKYKVSAVKDLKYDESTLSKCTFSCIKDLHRIPLSYTKYDCIITLNILDKLHSPKKFVNLTSGRVNKGGVLIFSECYDWNEDITPKAKWIGATDGKTSPEALKAKLPRTFGLIKEDQMSFIQRQNAFSFKLSIANTAILRKG